MRSNKDVKLVVIKIQTKSYTCNHISQITRENPVPNPIHLVDETPQHLANYL